MPDHVHLLLSLDGCGKAVWGYVGIWKGLWTRRLAMKKGSPFWQRTFYDHWIRSHEGREYAAYIVGNPVRKGLVRDWREYPFTRAYIALL